jgi:hypothetical protein
VIAAMMAGCGVNPQLSEGQSALASDAGAPRDWSRHPAVAQLDDVQELWAMSDVHGDYQAFTRLLTGAGLIAGAPSAPANAQWTGGASVLVIVGDLIDKGPDAPDVIRLVSALSQSASVAGGAVVATMGNHEAEFLANPENGPASSATGIDPELAALNYTPADTAAGNNDIGEFLRSMPVAARVDNWFFCHAGDTGGQTIAELESAVEAGVDSDGYGTQALSATSSLLEARLSGSGPQWWDATQDPQGLLTQWASAVGATHLVMGHQPGAVKFADGTQRAADQMYQAYGGALFLLDTGMSVDVANTGGALLHVVNVGLQSESWEKVLPDGRTQAL